jgi:glycolate oxidase FAD binding subunit
VGPGASRPQRAVALSAVRRAPGVEIGELDTPRSLAFWAELRDVALLPPAHLLWRLSVPPSAAAALIEELELQLPLQWLADWAGGLLWLALEDAPADGGAAAIRAALAPHGGHATLIRAPAELRGAVEVFQPQAEPLARLSARVKESFDPKRILNPGRMYEAI